MDTMLARCKLATLERNILELLNAFSEETGVEVKEIKIEWDGDYTHNQQTPLINTVMITTELHAWYKVPTGEQMRVLMDLNKDAPGSE